jgi:hypothetical protein
VISDVDLENITISPKNSGYSLAKGWSGSSLFINSGNEKKFMGLLTNIDGKSGIVLRADYMMNIMSGFFGKEDKPEQKEINEPQNKSVTASLGDLMTKQVKLRITKFEQINNKAIFNFTLENLNPSSQVIEYNTRVDYHKLIDQKGIAYTAQHIQYGNTGNKVSLVYKVPVNCQVEFEVGANSIAKASMLELNGYNYEFKFFNIKLNNSIITKKETPVPIVPNKVLSKQMDKQIVMIVNRFEQNNNKVLFHYTLENRNPSIQVVKYNTRLDYHNLIDQNGNSHNATDIQYGNNDNKVELVYNVPVSCFVEFEVGATNISKAALLQLNGYGYEFIYTNIDLLEENIETKMATKNGSINSKSVEDKKNILGTMEYKNVKIVVNSCEQIGSKLIFYYSLENIDPKNQVIKVNSRLDYASLEAENFKFNCKNIELGNTNSQAQLVYQFPVQCYAEFEVGAVKITKVKSLKLSLYSYEFEFVGKGNLGAPNSLKSLKAIEARNEILKTGAGTLIKILSGDKKN